MKNRGDQKLLAFLCTFIPIAGFIITLIKYKNKYIVHYSKQGFVIFLGFIISGLVYQIPIIGKLFYIFIVILWFLTWINAISGKEKKTWLVSEIAEKINF